MKPLVYILPSDGECSLEAMKRFCPEETVALKEDIEKQRPFIRGAQWMREQVEKKFDPYFKELGEANNERIDELTRRKEEQIKILSETRSKKRIMICAEKIAFLNDEIGYLCKLHKQL